MYAKFRVLNRSWKSKKRNSDLSPVRKTRTPPESEDDIAFRKVVILNWFLYTIHEVRLHVSYLIPLIKIDDNSVNVHLLDIQQGLMNQPVRAYPLRTVNEPSVYVMGEKAGTKVYPSGGPQIPQMHSAPGGSASMPPTTIGLGMNLNQQQAMIAQQNNTMESLERRRDRDRRETSSTAGVSTLVELINQQTAHSATAPTARRRRLWR